jgi:hypothetical protein
MRNSEGEQDPKNKKSPEHDAIFLGMGSQKIMGK